MATGDWVSGAHIELDSGSQVVFNADASLSILLKYWVIVPSGTRLYISTPYPYDADTSNSIAEEFATATEELANQEGIAVLTNIGGQIQTVQPESP